MQDLEKILQFLDDYTLDQQLYWQINEVYSKERYEIQWTSPNHWRFKNVTHTFWHETNSAELLEKLNQYKVDLVSFHTQIVSTALQQIIGGHFVVQGGRSLFGDEIVDKHIAEFEEFKNELLASIAPAIEQAKKEKQKSKLTIIKNQDEEVE